MKVRPLFPARRPLRTFLPCRLLWLLALSLAAVAPGRASADLLEAEFWDQGLQFSWREIHYAKPQGPQPEIAALVYRDEYREISVGSGTRQDVPSAAGEGQKALVPDRYRLISRLSLFAAEPQEEKSAYGLALGGSAQVRLGNAPLYLGGNLLYAPGFLIYRGREKLEFGADLLFETPGRNVHVYLGYSYRRFDAGSDRYDAYVIADGFRLGIRLLLP